MNLKQRKAIAKMLPQTGWGCCFRCSLPYSHAAPKETPYFDNTGGCFPLCVKCWRELRTPEGRFPFYRKLVIKWLKSARSLKEKKFIVRCKWKSILRNLFANK